MRIQLSPIASDHTTQVSLSGLVLTIDGVDYDLSVIPEGGEAEGQDGSPFLGKVTRDYCEITYHYDMRLAKSDQPVDRAAYLIEWLDGDMPSPIIWLETE